MKKMDFENGKYTLVLGEDGYTVTALRYDEPWRDFVGDKFITHLARSVFEKAQAPTDEERETLAYLITAHRFRERGLHGLIGEPEIASARPLADFLISEGFRRPAQADLDEALCGDWPAPCNCDDPDTHDGRLRRPAQTEPTDAQIEAIADSIESFFEEHVHMARRLYPDVWKRDLALVVLKAAFTAGQEDGK